ncbi:IniB N-terminal domain-containing protein [Pseudonocardia sp. GCM10023141]|uniref:IniB N-terminal domain-containing protein n=1 Tax=Pseudonocardia sp. GCM10023141 TaxID=3252653 RepID=UPI0036140B88
MSENLTLIEFVKQLLSNAELRNWFADDPQAALHEFGLDHLTAADVQDALVLVDDDSQGGDFSRNYDTGSNHVAAAHAAPAPHGHESAGEYIQRVFTTNNYIDDRDTIIDQSVNQNVNTGGGSFHQNIDNHSVNATGDGSIAAGGDIKDSTLVTGNGNTVGDGNVDGNGNVLGNGNGVVNGSDNTTSFGSGDATSTDIHGPVKVGDGAAFNSGSGNTAVNNSDNSLNDVGNKYTDNSQHHSNNTDVDASQHNSNNDGSDNSEHTSTHTEDSNNTDVDASSHSHSHIEDSFNHLHI